MPYTGRMAQGGRCVSACAPCRPCAPADSVARASGGDTLTVMDIPASTDAAMWRPDVTRGQLMRAAVGLETIADACGGRRRDELLELARGLRVRARTWHPQVDASRSARRLRSV